MNSAASSPEDDLQAQAIDSPAINVSSKDELLLGFKNKLVWETCTWQLFEVSVRILISTIAISWD